MAKGTALLLAAAVLAATLACGRYGPPKRMRGTGPVSPPAAAAQPDAPAAEFAP